MQDRVFNVLTLQLIIEQFFFGMGGQVVFSVDNLLTNWGVLSVGGEQDSLTVGKKDRKGSSRVCLATTFSFFYV